MKFSDLFVPRWQNSNPEVRAKAVRRLKDSKLLAQIAENDESDLVRQEASIRLDEIKEVQVTV